MGEEREVEGRRPVTMSAGSSERLGIREGLTGSRTGEGG